MSAFVRLRQVCLAVPELAPAEQDLRELFGVIPCHRDERVHRYGLINVVLTFGPTFVELVSPTRPDAAAGRFLDRHPPPLRGAYMAIFDCSRLGVYRERADSMGIRVINNRRYERYENLQLHPADVGATMVEIHHNVGGEDLFGHYEPAGADWQSTVRTDVTRCIRGVGIQTPRPSELAARWHALLGGLHQDHSLVLDHGVLQFEAAQEERASTIALKVADPGRILDQAAAKGYPIEGAGFTAHGVRWLLDPA